MSRRWGARAHPSIRNGVSPRWSRVPDAPPQPQGTSFETYEIVDLRKTEGETGSTRGPHTIAFHLAERHDYVPSVSTICRTLSRRGFVTP